jgi:hypothetical protein
LTALNYHNRIFRGVENYDSGDLNLDTRFYYHQSGNVVYGEILGGEIARGSLLALIAQDDSLDMVWHYASRDGRIVRGTCHSTPTILPDGRLRLDERWQIEGGEAGKSAIEEIGGDTSSE